jgi:YidC/Oxa1 family membrane protein insertase
VQFIDWLLGTPLGWVLYACYKLVGNYGLAIILFALVTKVILFPLSVLAQKNAIIMARLKPKVEDIKRRYAGNSSLVLEEQQKLYKRNHYSALKGTLPLLVQIPLILGVIAVVYHPLKHLLRLDAATIQALVVKAANVLGTTPVDLGLAGETRVLQLVQADPGAFAGVAPPDVLGAVQSVHLSFLGINLADVPHWGSVTLIWPVLSGLSALALSLYQNRYYVLQKFAGPGSRIGITVFLVLFSGYFAAVLPGAFGLYWTAGNLLGIAVVWLCNVVDDPRKSVDYSAFHKAVRLTPAERAAKRSDKRESAARSRVDVRRFRTTYGKRVMIYSEGSGYWKYFAGIVRELNARGVTVHYVTSDLRDKVFERADATLVPFYVAPKALIPFMMQLDVDMVIMTLPDLEKYHIKRSLVRKDIEYVYIDHGMGSLHLMLREGALDHFDTVLCGGPNHVEEMRETEAAYHLPAKRLVRTGYPLLDDMLLARATDVAEPNPVPVALIAPSWQPENILELCLADTVRPLLDKGFHVIIRPHPEFVKQFGDKIRALQAAWRAETDAGTMEIQTDFSSASTVYRADVMVTDWSTIAQEFSYTTKKPSLFINTPMKVMNPHYAAIAAIPLEVSLRDEVGVSLDLDELGTIGDVAEEMVLHPEVWRERITAVMEANQYNLGTSASACADYIVASLAEQDRGRALAAAETAWREGTASADQEQLLVDEMMGEQQSEAAAIRAEAAELEQRAAELRGRAATLEASVQDTAEVAHA